MTSAVGLLDPQGRPPARFPRTRTLFRRPPTERRMRLSPHVALQCRIPQSLPLRKSVMDSVVAVTADLPRSWMISSKASAVCITRTPPFLVDPWTPVPLRPVSGLPALLGGALLPVGWAAQRGPVSHVDAGLFCAASLRTRRARFPAHRALQRFMPRARPGLRGSSHFLPRSRRTSSTTSASALRIPHGSLIVHRLCPFALWTVISGLQIGRTLPRRLMRALRRHRTRVP